MFVRNQLWVYLAVCLAVCVYLVLRAVNVPIVHDESATFFFYVNTGEFIPFVNWGDHPDVNNHILNSFLTFYADKWFGDSIFSLRLPSLLFSIMLFVYVWKIGQWLRHVPIRWIFILAMLTSYYMLEFFALSRGYGMSMALLVAALFYLLRYVRESRLSDLILLGLLLLLSTLANLTIVNTYLICFCIVILTEITGKRLSLKRILIVTVLMVGPIIGFVLMGMEYKKMGLLYYGEGESFYDITILSLVTNFTHAKENPLPVLIVCGAMLLIMLVVVVYQRFKKPLDWQNPATVMWMLFWGNVGLILFQTTFMDVNYPEDRTGLYFYPLMIGALCFAADTMNKWKWYVLPLLYIPLHLFLAGNTDYIHMWRGERQPQKFYDQVLAYAREHNIQPTIGGHYLHKLVWDFYNFQHDGPLTGFQPIAFPDTIGDFQVGKRGLRKEWETLYDEIDHDEASNISLYKRKRMLKRNLFWEAEGLVWETDVTNEFINFYSTSEFDLGGKIVLAEFNYDFDPADPPANAWVVIQGVRADTTLFYNYFSLERYRENFDTIKKTQTLLYTDVIPGGPVDLRCYIWNLGREKISITNGKLRLYYLE